MTTQIVRVGHTLTVEIPEELVAQASLAVGEPVEWVSSGCGSITLAKPSGILSPVPQERMTLEELLEAVEDDTSLGEFDWGSPRGVEVW
jgi:antitoxin component of MazEF toxin-antitoxin module